MFDRKFLLAAPVLMALATPAAHAAVQADALWADLTAQATEAGLQLQAASSDKTSDGRMLRDVTLSEKDGTVIARLSQLALVEHGDGSLSFVPGEFKLQDIDEAAVNVTHRGLDIQVYEDKGGFGYGWKAEELKVEVKTASVSEDAQDGLDEGLAEEGFSWAVDSLFEFRDLAGRYTRGSDALDLAASAGHMNYAIASVSGELEQSSKQSSETEKLEMSGRLQLPAGGLALPDLAKEGRFLQAVDQGMGLTLAMSQGKSTSYSSDDNSFMPMTIAMNMEPGHASLSLDKSSFAMSSVTDAIALKVGTAMFETPVDVSFGRTAFGVKLPVQAVAEAGDYALTLELADLTLDPAVWNMFDSQNQLDHGPAQLKIDLSGKAKADIITMAMENDLSDEENLPAAMPEVQSLDINDLLVKVAGGMLTGNGNFTFDNSTGMPQPVGTAEFVLKGANRVFDGLVSMGMMTEEDLSGARMMLMMFGNPVEGEEDTLQSKVEAKADGSIFVNGQQMQ